MILPLRYYDDPILRKKVQAIIEVTDEIRVLARDMIESMIHYNGVGIAAPQVGQSLSMFIIRDEIMQPDGSYTFGEPEVMINPHLSKPSQEKAVMSEGCLSIPGVHADVIRPAAVHIRYQTLDGRLVEELVSGFRARVIMHENDHLNGVLFFDRLSPELRKKVDPLLRSVKQKYKSQGPSH